MKHTKIFFAALALTILAGCANQTGVYRPDPATKKLEPEAVVISRGDGKDEIEAKGKLLGQSAAAKNALDTTLNPAERTVNAAIAAGADLRRLARIFHEGIVGSTAADATAPALTEVQKKLLGDGFVFERGKWYAPKNLDPARLSPLSEEGAKIVYEKKDLTDQGELIRSIKAKYQ